MAPKERDHGEGGLFFLPSRGLWRGVVDDGFTADGNRRQRYVHAKTRDECLKKLRRAIKEIEETGHALDRRTTVATLAEAWLADAALRLKPKTLQGYRSHVAVSIVPALGKRAIADLRPSDVRLLHSTIFARGSGPPTAAGAHRTLSAMLGFAVDEGLIGRNVAESVHIPRQAPAARGSLTRTEAESLMALHDPRWTMALLTGARDGELRGLRIEDLDLDHNLAHISWTLAEVNSHHGCGGSCGRKHPGACPQRILDIAPNLEAQPIVGRWALVRPKSYKPRVVPLTPGLTDGIRAHLASDRGPNPHNLVWHRPDGAPFTNRDSNALFQSVLARAGIGRTATTHWLRHTYTTMAEHAGIPWVVYAGISGHGSEDISRRYTHQLEEQSRAGVSSLEKYLNGGG